MSRVDLQAGLHQLHCSLDEGQINQLEQFVEMLLRWNKVYNLTAIRDESRVVPLHILDSLSVAPFIQGSNCLDVGSGGGLPGIPLAITQVERQFTLLDTVGKKTRFIQQAAIQLGLKNVQVVNARVENWSPETKFDAIISRAFASVHDFVNLTARHLKDDGSIYAMKGRYPAEELAGLPKGFRVVSEHELSIPQLDVERFLIEIKQDG